MQIYNNHEIISKVFNSRSLSSVFYGVRLVWMAVRSCFGSGVWVGDKPWIGNEHWKNNK